MDPTGRLPTGTVTLLLGDIEGSTRLWQERPADMSAAMSELDAVIDELVAKFEGVRPREQGEGDNFVAAFARASDAVICALEVQRRVLDGPLRMRMGVHSGEIEIRDERYDGPTIIRAARLRDIGHGGQTLLSSATRDLVQDVLPDGADTIDVGSHQLKGLDRPERVYQLVHPSLPSRFPALRSSGVSKGHVPVRRTNFVGRTTELAEIMKLVDANRLVTLTGAGGCGKTRLSVEAASRLSEAYPDGAWFCDLGPLSDPDVVAQTLRTTLGLREETSRGDLETVCAGLSEAHALVILDNCEHLLAASAEIADALLRACPRVHVLTTSREPLGVEGEVAWRVPSLSAPSNGGTDLPEELARFDAVRLFVERAAQARPGFALTAENAASVAEICTRLDGIPLAIELAAARTRILSVQDLASGLNDRFRLLGRGARNVLARQQTLEASVAWSHEMLSSSQKAALRRLAAFAGSFTLEGAEHVVAAKDVQRAEVLELVSQLVDRSLVIAEDATDGTRYRLLETIRQYARERLVDSGEARDVAARHRDFHIAWLEQLFERARSGAATSQEATRAVDRAYDNLREACEWALADRRYEEGLRLACSLFELWWLWFGLTSETRTREGLRWLEELLAGEGITPRTRVRAMFCIAQAKFWSGQFLEGASVAHEALPFARDLGDPALLGRVTMVVGYTLGFAEPERGITMLNEAIELARRSNDRTTLWQSLFFLAQVTFFCGDQALAAVREGLLIAEGINLDAGILRLGIGFALVQMGQIGAGVDELDAAMRTFRASGEPTWGSRTLIFRSFAMMMLDDRSSARDAADEAALLAEQDAAERELSILQARFFLALLAIDEGRFDEVDDHLGRLGAHDFVSYYAGLIGALRGCVRSAMGDAAGARSELNDAVANARGIGWPVIQVIVWTSCARIARGLGELSEAESYVNEALSKIAEIGPQVLAPDVLDVAAVLRAHLGADADAVRLFGAANASRAHMGLVRRADPTWSIVDEMDAVRARIGEDAYTRALTGGERLTLDDALSYALRGRGSRQRADAGWDSLTPTELKVVALVAEGLSNPQIAERLFITRRTVSTHLSHVFPKLGVSSRAELAAEAAKRGI